MDGADEKEAAVGASLVAMMLAWGLEAVVLVAGLGRLDAAAGANLSAADQAAWPVPVVGLTAEGVAAFVVAGSSTGLSATGYQHGRTCVPGSTAGGSTFGSGTGATAGISAGGSGLSFAPERKLVPAKSDMVAMQTGQSCILTTLSSQVK